MTRAAEKIPSRLRFSKKVMQTFDNTPSTLFATLSGPPQDDPAIAPFRLLDAILQASSDCISVTDREGRYQYMGSEAARLLGREPAAVLGRTDVELNLVPAMAEELNRQRQEVLCTGRPVRGRAVIPTVIGPRSYEHCYSPIFDAEGNVTAVLCVARDVTVRDEAEQTLHASQKSLQMAIAAGKLGYWQLDVATGALDASETCVQNFGFASGQITYETLMQTIVPEDRSGVRECVERALATGEDYAAEYRVMWPDGSIRWIEASGHAFYNEAGKPCRMAGTTHDVTESRLRAIEIEALNTRLQRAMAETHHRVKNNLQVISALAEMQAGDGAELIPAAALKRIGQHVRTLALMHDLLTQEVKTGSDTERLSVRTLLEKLLPMIQATVGAHEVSFTLDEVQMPLKQGASLTMLVNELVSNGAKHGRSAIEVSLRAVKNENGNEAVLEVCDDGPGFSPGFNWRTAANTGLELIDSLARWDLRGTVTFENRAEGGARVRVQMPLPEQTAK